MLALLEMKAAPGIFFTEYGHWGTLLVDTIIHGLKTDRIKLGFLKCVMRQIRSSLDR